MRPIRAALFLTALAFGATVHAATAYKCVDARGAISFQDQPCRSGAKQQSIRLPDSAPAPQTPVAAAPPPPNAVPPPQPVPPEPAPPAAPAIPPPEFYLCARADGSVYMSETGEGGSMAVPVGMGIANRSLADAYSGPNSIGVSAPGLRTIPSVPARSVPFGAGYTWIYDECHFAQPQEACGYLRMQLDDVSERLRKAFSDTAPSLKQQQASLRDRMHGC